MNSKLRFWTACLLCVFLGTLISISLVTPPTPIRTTAGIVAIAIITVAGVKALRDVTKPLPVLYEVNTATGEVTVPEVFNTVWTATEIDRALRKAGWEPAHASRWCWHRGHRTENMNTAFVLTVNEALAAMPPWMSNRGIHIPQPPPGGTSSVG